MNVCHYSPGSMCGHATCEHRAALEQLRIIIARVTAERDEARNTLRLAVRWMGDANDPLTTFEDIADWFYRDTGFLRPGKSEPLECGDRSEEREAAWKVWAKQTREQVYETCRAVCGIGKDEK